MIFSIPELDATGRLEHKGTNSKKDARHEKIKFDVNIMEDSREGSSNELEKLRWRRTKWRLARVNKDNGLVNN